MESRNTELRDILAKSGVRSAVVIDDVFDDVPRSDELSDEEWNVFFADLSNRDKELIGRIFPDYENMQVEELKMSDEFVKALWDHREELTESVRKVLFEDYENQNYRELQDLDKLVKELEKFGLQCETMGNEINEATDCADLLIVDLFLGKQQHDEDIDRTINILKKIAEERDEPPLVVLTSRSNRLEMYRDRFRDKVGLLGSTFRVIHKRDITDTGNLGRLLRRLADHYGDAKKIARFIRAWNTGMDHARDRLIAGLRRLDLPDLAQIRALMLEFEGQKLGEYLLEVADRVLRYEIEASEDTIGAAIELNSIDLEKYPAPHLTGPDYLQDIVYRGMFLHDRRLNIPENDDGIRLQFGDVLWWINGCDIFQGFDVSLVVTPACDLARRAVEGIMLLPGTLQKLEPIEWSYKQNPPRTPVVFLPDKQRRWIEWNFKEVKVVANDKLSDLLKDEKKVEHIGRLRELHTIDLQQKMLANLGRVGTPADPPIRFAVQVSLYYVGMDLKLKSLNNLSDISATCYVGRDAKSNPVRRLVLMEHDCDEVERVLQDLSDTEIQDKFVRTKLSAVRGDRSFFDKLGRGEIEVPASEAGSKPVEGLPALVSRDRSYREGCTLEKKDRKGAALIIQVVDVRSADV